MDVPLDNHQHSYGPLPDVLDLTHQIVRTDELVGIGGFGSVYKGRWVGAAAGSGAIAVKVIGLEPLDKKRRKARFKQIKRELTLWSKINHKNILPLLGIARINEKYNVPAFVCPLMENGNARAFLSRNPSFPPLLILYDIINGLHYLHTFEPEIVHGDIKALNVLINDRYEACLCDFGLSRFLIDNTLWRTSATQAGGSARWMSPELIDGTACTPTKASDIYAYGMTCYELLSGDVPFGTTAKEANILFKILNGQRPMRTESCVPDLMWDIITRCWIEEPEKRLSTEKVLGLVQEIVGPLALSRSISQPSESQSNDDSSDSSVSETSSFFSFPYNKSELASGIQIPVASPNTWSTTDITIPIQQKHDLSTLSTFTYHTAVTVAIGTGTGGGESESLQKHEDLLSTEKKPELLAQGDLRSRSPPHVSPSSRNQNNHPSPPKSETVYLPLAPLPVPGYQNSGQGNIIYGEGEDPLGKDEDRTIVGNLMKPTNRRYLSISKILETDDRRTVVEGLVRPTTRSVSKVVENEGKTEMTVAGNLVKPTNRRYLNVSKILEIDDRRTVVEGLTAQSVSKVAENEGESEKTIARNLRKPTNKRYLSVSKILEIGYGRTVVEGLVRPTTQSVSKVTDNEGEGEKTVVENLSKPTNQRYLSVSKILETDDGRMVVESLVRPTTRRYLSVNKVAEDEGESEKTVVGNLMKPTNRRYLSVSKVVENEGEREGTVVGSLGGPTCRRYLSVGKVLEEENKQDRKEVRRMEQDTGLRYMSVSNTLEGEDENESKRTGVGVPRKPMSRIYPSSRVLDSENKDKRTEIGSLGTPTSRSVENILQGENENESKRTEAGRPILRIYPSSKVLDSENQDERTGIGSLGQPTSRRYLSASKILDEDGENKNKGREIGTSRKPISKRYLDVIETLENEEGSDREGTKAGTLVMSMTSGRDQSISESENDGEIEPLPV